MARAWRVCAQVLSLLRHMARLEASLLFAEVCMRACTLPTIPCMPPFLPSLAPRLSVSELFAARPPSKGTTVARHPDSRLQMDLVDYKHKSEKGNAGKKYLMLAQNPWSKELFSTALDDNTEASVKQGTEALVRKAFGEKKYPEEISTDVESGWLDSSPAGEWMKAKGIAHRIKSAGGCLLYTTDAADE